VALTHFIESLSVRFLRYPPLRPFIGGLVLIGLYQLIDPQIYAGLGIEVIQDKLTSGAGFLMPAYKALATALTLGTGFKGGEFIPLVFIGTTLGSALSLVLPASVALLSSVGFAALFGAAANTPVACTIMAIEIFGAPIAPYALVGCFVSYVVASHKGIYDSQRVHGRKPRIKSMMSRS
jgi:H+/Cl- antiporter ClcA